MCRRLRPHILQAGELAGGPVSGVDDRCLDVALVNGDHLGGRCRHIDSAVVVGGGLRRGLAVEVGVGRCDGVRHQGADILQHGHGLLAIDDVLHGGNFGVLPGDHVAADVRIGAESIGDSARGAVVGRQDEHVTLVVRTGGGQVGFGQVLGSVEVPFGGDLAEDLAHLFAGQFGLVLQGHRLAGVDDVEGAVGDLGLQHVPGAFEEQEGVVVRGRTGVQVQRIAFPAGLVHQVLALGLAYCDAVKGDVVVHRIRLADQAVVGDHLHPGVVGGLGGCRGGGRVLRRDDDHLDALGDQVLHVGQLSGRVALAEQDLDVYAHLVERILETGLILDPAGFIPGRQDDANGEFAAGGRRLGGLRRFSCCRFGRFHGGSRRTSRQEDAKKDQRCYNERQRTIDLLAHYFLSLT